MIYHVIIKDKDQRMRFAADTEKILKKYKKFIPGRNQSRSEEHTSELLAQVEALIDRPDQEYIKREKPG